LRGIDDLRSTLRRIDGRGYRAYKDIAGEYGAGRLRLTVDHVQGDPFAEPSRLRASVPPAESSLPDWTRETPLRRIATADFLNRALAAELDRRSARRGSGRSGDLRVLRPRQQVLRRACLTVFPDGAVEARFRAGLPARGRRVLGREAERLIDDALAALEAALLFESIDGAALLHHIETVEDAAALRAQLGERGLVAFVADGASLPRRSGIDDRPLDDAVPFRSPDSLRITLHAPNAGDVAGMGVARGVTLIVGGGFHGKSTLLRALERGVYDHVPGDGRERVVAVAGAVKVRAEDGRAVAGVDISNFIGPLPGGGDTRAFTTENASGSTSQAAAIVEALEAGASCLLLDEDTSATNFMIRDARMQALIGGAREPITPFIDRARQLADELGIATVLVVGGSGDYFDVADTVIAMTDYVPADVTADACRVAEAYPTRRAREGGAWRTPARRIPMPDSLDPARGRRDVHVRAFSEERLAFGEREVDLSAVEQLVDPAQTRAMAHALAWARGRAIDGRNDLRAALDAIMAALHADGLDTFQRERTGELAEFRSFELAAFLGRIRGFRTVAID
jgi:predicted ABC-class ATPase